MIDTIIVILWYYYVFDNDFPLKIRGKENLKTMQTSALLFNLSGSGPFE